MAIKSSTFSGWQLSGKDAKAFEKQVNELKTNSAAQAALDRGQKLAAEYIQNGYVSISVTSKNETSPSSEVSVAASLQETKNKS